MRGSRNFCPGRGGGGGEGGEGGGEGGGNASPFNTNISDNFVSGS